KLHRAYFKREIGPLQGSRVPGSSRKFLSASPPGSTTIRVDPMDAAAAPLAEKVSRLVLEYAQARPANLTPGAALDGKLTLRGDLAIDSLALVSLTIRLGEEFGVDVVESNLDFSQMQTVGDLVVIAGKLSQR
ncbi:MAG TPA: acyl carrier protein, partial [Polyangia bacterium]|nr:acyl carrier protein [Polyangia bacterium]